MWLRLTLKFETHMRLLPGTLRLPPPPALLSVPSLIIAEQFLNCLLADAIQAGDLDFLIARRVRIRITNLSFEFDIGFSGQRITLDRSLADADLYISGGSYEYLLLASRSEDADTLFFQRRLQTEGDTELGLEVKNFLDGQDLSGRPVQQLIETGLKKLARTLGFFRPPQSARTP